MKTCKLTQLRSQATPLEGEEKNDYIKEREKHSSTEGKPSYAVKCEWSYHATPLNGGGEETSFTTNNKNRTNSQSVY